MAHSFQWIKATIGIFISLSVARLITSAANMFIARKSVAMDWVPFGWTLTIFFLLLQFAWSFIELDTVIDTWTFNHFVMLLAYVLSLFSAAALILPNIESQAGKSLRDWFALNGRWALSFVVLYALLLYPLRWYLVSLDADSNQAAGILEVIDPGSLILITVTLVAMLTKSRRVLASATILDLALTLALLVEGVIDA